MPPSFLMVINYIVQGAGYIGVALLVAFFFGLCVFFHELGHLLTAIHCKLHVEKFSVGFGRALKKWRWRGIDIQVGWIPFGGFVALPQLEPTDEPKTSDGDPLPHAGPLSRIATAFAGPFFNIILGVLLGGIVWIVGVKGFPYDDFIAVQSVPQTFFDAAGTEHDNPEYVAGLRDGDVLVAVNGKGFSRGWEEAQRCFIFAPRGRVQLTVERQGERLELPEYKLAPNPLVDGIGYPFFRPRLPTAVGGFLPQSAAKAAGLKVGDELLKLNGEEVEGIRFFIDKIAANGAKPADLLVRRGKKELPFAVTPAATEIELEPGRTETRYLIGISLDSRVIVHPSPWRQFANTMSMSYQTVNRLGDGESLIGPKHMSGPIGILHALVVAFVDGIPSGLKLVALLSFALAVMNLLPIPVLDGGHILFGLIELGARRRIPTKIAVPISYAFVILIITFALFITFYDAMRVKTYVIDDPPALRRSTSEGAPREKAEALPPATIESPAAEPAAP